jgi:hypothetical protein
VLHVLCFVLFPAGTPQQRLPVTISAGAEGATLLVCPSRFPNSAQLSTAADQHPPAVGNTLLLPPGQGFGQGQNPASTPQGTPGGLQPPMLTRHSPGSSLARISPVLAGRVGPQKGPTGGVAGSPGMPVVQKLAQNTYSRCNMAAAVAAADALMSPLPGSSTSAARLAAAAAAGGGGVGVGGGLARVSPTPVVSRVSPSPGSLTAAGGTRGSLDNQQGRAAATAAGAGGVAGGGGGAAGGPPSLSRTSSNLPLAGAQVDTAFSLGVDMRAGPMGSLSLGVQANLGSAVAAANGVGSVPAANGGDASAAAADSADLPSSLTAAGGAAAAAGEGGEDQAAAEAAAAVAASRRQQLRRSRSQRPLHGTGGTQGGERHVGR